MFCVIPVFGSFRHRKPFDYWEILDVKILNPEGTEIGHIKLKNELAKVEFMGTEKGFDFLTFFF